MSVYSITLFDIILCTILLLLCVGSTLQHPAVKRDKRSARLYTGAGGYVPTSTIVPGNAGGVSAYAGAGNTQAPGSGAEFNSQNMQLWYLNRYGYISDNSKQEISNVISQGGSQPSVMTRAIRKFQRMMSIPETGLMDSQTKAAMASPRCGNKDIPFTNKRRRKRYNHYGSEWVTTVITWKILTFSRQMDHQTQIRIITHAFEQWSAVTPLQFVQDQSDSTPNIEIQWLRRDHFDGYPFDGPGGVLAHAFYLNPGSYFTRVHFDEDEYWTESLADIGINLLWVARHEIGHAIGLGHSENYWATMRATYYPFDLFRNILGNDDIEGIRARYGVQRTDHLCSVGKMAAILTVNDDTFIILNSFMLIATKNQLHPKIYAVTQRFAKNMNNVIDAMFQYGTLTYIFQGDTMYIYTTDNEGLFVYLTEIPLSQVITFGITYVSAAFVYQNKAYLVQGNVVYQVQPNGATHNLVLQGTTDLTDDWEIPNTCEVSAATTWLNNVIYFFCVDYYYRYPRDQQDLSYPKVTSENWWGCRGTGSLQGTTGSSVGRHHIILENTNRVQEPVAVPVNIASLYSIHPGIVVFFILQTIFTSIL